MFDTVSALLVVEGDYRAVFVGRESGAVQKYRLADLGGRPALTLEGHQQAVTALVAAPNGGPDDIYSTSTDKTIRLWNASDDIEAVEGGRRCVKTTATCCAIRCAVAVGELLCCGGSDGGVHTLRDGKMERWQGHTDVVSCVAAAPEAPLVASGSYDGQLIVWEVNAGAAVYVLRGHTSHVKAALFVGQGAAVVACGRDDTLRLWLLPPEGEEGLLAGAGHDAHSGADEEGEEGHTDNDGSALGHTTTSAGARVIKNHAVIGLPATPACIAAQPESESPLLAIGAANGTVLTVRANKLYSAVNTFVTRNGYEARTEQRRLKQLNRQRTTAAKQAQRRALRKKRRQLLQEQHKEEQAQRAKARAERAAERRAERDEEDDEGDEFNDGDGDEDLDEDMGEEGEEGDEEPLTAERQEALDAFAAEQKEAMVKQLQELRTAVADRLALLRPVAEKVFERTAAQFATLPFTRVHPQQAAALGAPEDTVRAVALVSAVGYKTVIAVNNKLRVADCTPGSLAI